MSNQKDKKSRGTQSGIYHMVYQQGPLARPEIGRRLGVSLPTVMQGVKELAGKGLLEEGAMLPSTGGRKAVGIQCAANARVALGVDITKNHASLVVVNLKNEVLAQHRAAVSFASTADYWAEIGRLVAALRVQAGVPAGNYLGVGVSIPGVVSADGKTLNYSHVLQETALKTADFEQLLGGPCLLCNDANAAGFAEMWDAPPRDTALYLSLSNSVGGAIVMGGRPLRGQHGRCGEFGHATLVPGGKACYCGQKGCVDAYCSATQLSQYTGGDLPAFFARLEEGEAKMTAVWKEYLAWLAVTVNNLITNFDSPVILGGYLGEFIEPYIRNLQALIAARTTFSGNEHGVRSCRYKKKAAAVGAALLWTAPFLEAI